MSDPTPPAKPESFLAELSAAIKNKILHPDETTWANEIRANLVLAQVMTVSAAADLLYLLLALLGLPGAGIRIAPGVLAGVFLLLAIPAIICFRWKGQKKELKLILIAACVLAFALIELVLPRNVALCLAVPILLSARYYSGPLTACTGALSALSLLVTSLLSPLSHLGLAELFLFLLITIICIEIAHQGRAVIVQEQETERLSTELMLAKTIQENMIPNTFPAYPERKEFDLYARTEPAKELGGDFYDFQMIDKDHLALIIADVAGKGIPAAMFMMASKIIIQGLSKSRTHDPAKILKAVNRQIGANNPADMFVTLWLGILEISTGRLKAANAGHEYPCLRHNDGEYRLLKDPHGLVLGAMDESEYRDYELQLVPGDTFFVYTDGVTEAANAEGELFGTERMTEALNQEPNAPVAKLLDNVRGAIRLFVKEAPSSDDITMLALRYFGSEGKFENDGAES